MTMSQVKVYKSVARGSNRLTISFYGTIDMPRQAKRRLDAVAARFDALQVTVQIAAPLYWIMLETRGFR